MYPPNIVARLPRKVATTAKVIEPLTAAKSSAETMAGLVVAGGCTKRNHTANGATTTSVKKWSMAIPLRTASKETSSRNLAHEYPCMPQLKHWLPLAAS